VSRGRWAAVPICAGLALALLSANARGETFVFQDSERGERQGKVLVEFSELLFVAIDGEGPTFLRRAELRAIVDEAGKRHEQPPLGTFAAIGNQAPAVAVTDVTGSVWLSAGSAVATTPGADLEPGQPAPSQPGPTKPEGPLEFDEDAARPGETSLRQQEGGAEFVAAGGGLRTGENGVVHGLFPSGAQFWIGVESEVSFPGPTEQIGLGAGELSLESRLTPLQILTARPLDLRLSESSYVVVQRAGRVIKLDQQRGRTRIAWPEFSFVLHGGQSVALSDLGKGRWTVQADSANDQVIHLMVKGKKESLDPGKERELGTEVVSETSLWRHLASSGEILLRRGLQGTFRPVLAADRSLLSLGPGDALRTPAGGEAALVRQDGARLSLKSSTWLEVDGDQVQLVRGEALVEALGAPVAVATPGGRAGLSQTVALLKRVGEGASAPLEVTAVAGRPRIPLGYAALSLEAQSRALLSQVPTPADPPAELEALEERARSSVSRDEAVDALREGDRRVAAREGDSSQPEGAEPEEAGPEANPEDGKAPVDEGGRGVSEKGPPTPGGLPESSPRDTTPQPAAPLPASSGEATLPSFQVQLLRGRGQIQSGPVEELGDPGYRVALDQGDVVAVRPPSRLKPLGGVSLPAERELRFRGAGLDVEVVVEDPPALRWEGLKDVKLKEGLVVALNRVRELPALEFRSGERLLLAELPHTILVENPTVVVEGAKATIEFLQGIEATLRAAGQFGAQAFVTREDDHLETLKGAETSLGQRNSNVELRLADGRQLWIQPEAPAVDARVSDAQGTLFLSMPGAPSLGIRPETPLTVLATNEGEFVILDSDRVDPAGLERQGLGFGIDSDALSIDSERILDLLDVPLPDSPSGP